MNPSKNLLAAASGALALIAAPAFAEEGGAGHYVPGSMATIIDLAPTKPGWVIESIYLHYDGDAGANASLPNAGLVTANLDATSDAFLLGGFYTFENKVFGAHYSIGAFVPYVWMEATATVTAGGLAGERTDTTDDIGDITLMPLLLGWKCDEWQYDLALPIYAPTGDYKLGQLANAGRNHWTFDPTVGVTYSGKESMFNASLHTGFAINTENFDTDYKSGTVWHTELALQKLFPVGSGFMGLGLNAFYYQQITGDTGRGANFGDFKGRTAGVGPVITYMLPCGENTWVFEGRWLPELETKRRLEGDYFWVKAVYQF